jgi:hypothetical protein
MLGKRKLCAVKYRDVHLAIGCPSTKRSKGVVLAKARRVGRVTAIPWEAGIEAEERHGGWCPVVGCVGVLMRESRINQPREW